MSAAQARARSDRAALPTAPKAKTMKKIALTLACSAAAVLAAPAAHAEYLQFYSGNSSLSIDDGAARQCPIGTSVSGCSGTSDLFSPNFGSLKYNTAAGGVLSVTGTSNSNSGAANRVIQDRAPAFGGLGVTGNPSDDNVGKRETLTFSFERTVRLTDFVLFDIDHATNFHGGKFDLFVDGTRVINDGTLANLVSGLSYAGTSFAFTTGSDNAADNQGFYVGGVNVNAVPLPGTLALMGAAFAGMGALRRHRKA